MYLRHFLDYHFLTHLLNLTLTDFLLSHVVCRSRKAKHFNHSTSNREVQTLGKPIKIM